MHYFALLQYGFQLNKYFNTTKSLDHYFIGQMQL